MFRGELWQALADEALPADAKVYVTGVDGLVLRVSTTPPRPVDQRGSFWTRLAFLLRRKAA